MGAAVLGYALALLLAISLAEIRLLELLRTDAVSGWDKALHMVGFLIMGVLAAKFFINLLDRQPSFRSLIGALTLGGAYAIFHEGVQ